MQLHANPVPHSIDSILDHLIANQIEAAEASRQQYKRAKMIRDEIQRAFGTRLVPAKKEQKRFDTVAFLTQYGAPKEFIDDYARTEAAQQKQIKANNEEYKRIVQATRPKAKVIEFKPKYN